MNGRSVIFIVLATSASALDRPALRASTALMAKPRSSAPIATSATLGADGGRDRTTLAAVGAALASLLQGYHTGVIGGALLYLAPEFGLATDPKLTGAIVTATTVGSVVGTAAAARLSDGIGRRSTLAIASWASLAGSALLCVSRTAGGLVAARGLVGVAVGMAGAVVPVYIAETAQASRRGALAAIPQTFVSLGIFSAYLVSLLIAAVFPAAGWRGFALATTSTSLPAPRPPLGHPNAGGR